MHKHESKYKNTYANTYSIISKDTQNDTVIYGKEQYKTE